MPISGWVFGDGDLAVCVPFQLYVSARGATQEWHQPVRFCALAANCVAAFVAFQALQCRLAWAMVVHQAPLSRAGLLSYACDDRLPAKMKPCKINLSATTKQCAAVLGRDCRLGTRPLVIKRCDQCSGEISISITTDTIQISVTV